MDIGRGSIRKPQFKNLINQLENKIFNHTKLKNNLRAKYVPIPVKKKIFLSEKRELITTIDTYIKVILANFLKELRETNNSCIIKKKNLKIN